MARSGNITDTDGKIIGQHEGIEFYTIGQRKGMGISFTAPLYVTKIDTQKNEITAGTRQYLKSRKLFCGHINLLVDRLPSRAKAKIRYNHKEAFCSINLIKSKNKKSRSINNRGNNNIFENRLEVIFDQPQEAITPGQSVVFYENDTVLGGGIIESPDVLCQQ